MPWIVSLKENPSDIYPQRVLSKAYRFRHQTTRPFESGTVHPANVSLSSQVTRTMSCPLSSTLRTTSSFLHPWIKLSEFGTFQASAKALLTQAALFQVLVVLQQLGAVQATLKPSTIFQLSNTFWKATIGVSTMPNFIQVHRSSFLLLTIAPFESGV